MTEEFTVIEVSKSVARICKSLGWTRITSTAFRTLTDILSSRILKLILTAGKYAMAVGQTQLEVRSVHRALVELRVELSDLNEYCEITRNIKTPPLPLYPLPPKVPLARIGPHSGKVIPGLIHVHDWLNHCKKDMKKIENVRVRKSQRIRELKQQNTFPNEMASTSGEGMFKKPIGRAPQAKRLKIQEYDGEN